VPARAYTVLMTGPLHDLSELTIRSIAVSEMENKHF
jgi:hypothetical protein